MHGEIHHVTSRGEVKFVGSRHMIVFLGILDQCRTRLGPFLELSAPSLPLETGLYRYKWDDTGRNWFITVERVYTGTNTIIPVQKGLAWYKIVCASTNWFFLLLYV
jgi:hypothetical protein